MDGPTQLGIWCFFTLPSHRYVGNGCHNGWAVDTPSSLSWNQVNGWLCMLLKLVSHKSIAQFVCCFLVGHLNFNNLSQINVQPWTLWFQNLVSFWLFISLQKIDLLQTPLIKNLYFLVFFLIMAILLLLVFLFHYLVKRMRFTRYAMLLVVQMSNLGLKDCLLQRQWSISSHRSIFTSFFSLWYRQNF